MEKYDLSGLSFTYIPGDEEERVTITEHGSISNKYLAGARSVVPDEFATELITKRFNGIVGFNIAVLFDQTKEEAIRQAAEAKSKK